MAPTPAPRRAQTKPRGSQFATARAVRTGGQGGDFLATIVGSCEAAEQFTRAASQALVVHLRNGCGVADGDAARARSVSMASGQICVFRARRYDAPTNDDESMHARTIALTFAVVVAAGANVQAQSEAVPAFKEVDSIEARVQGCVTCHGQSGQGTSNGYFPRIAGKPAGYLYNQLLAFRDGNRRYPPMNYLVAYLPDAYLREIAQHFAKQQPPFAAKETAAADAAATRRGRLLVSAGDSSKGIPACIDCHGAGLTGMEPGIPGLVGLRPNYIVAQLTRWQVGERHAAEPDCMKRVATRLSDTDITAIAAWLSQQEAPRNPAPESSNLVRMPFACGSQR
jgi:cytochrome c553